MSHTFTVTEDADSDTEEKPISLTVTYTDGYVTKIETNYIAPVTELSKVDINFDGLEDIQMQILIGAYNVGTEFYVQNPDTRDFEQYEISSDIAYGPEYPVLGYVTVDTEKRILTNGSKGRGLGDIFLKELYTFTDGGWELSVREYQNFYTPTDQPTESGEQYYINTITDYGSNPPIVKKKYLKLEEGADDFIEITR